jgi:hypothetical protein
MFPAIKSVSIKISAARPEPEFPAVTFNRLCYSYLNNDWIMVISSCFTLATTLFTLLLSFNNNFNIKINI